MADVRSHHPRAVGLSWFRKEDYAALRALFTDGHRMPETWEEWLAGAEKAEKDIKARADIVERVYIDPATFREWCMANDCGIDREGRNLFVGMAMAVKYSGTH